MGWRGRRAPFWRAASGWPTTTRSRAGCPRRASCSSGCCRCATTSACWPRSTSPGCSGRSATSPRPSRTWRWSSPPTSSTGWPWGRRSASTASSRCGTEAARRSGATATCRWIGGQPPTMRDRVCLFLANRSNAYQAAMEREAVLAAARHQMPLEVHDARGSTPRQLEQMMEVLRAPTARQVYAAMVLPLDDVIHERAGREAVRGGIGWVLLNRQAEYIEDLRLGYPALPLFSLTPDHRQIGRAQAAIVKALLPRGGKVLSVTGPLTAVSARLRREGLDHGLEGAGFQIAHLPGDWTRPGGEQAI